MALLDKLGEVNWRKASHTRGIATDVPDLLRELVDPDRSIRDNAQVALADRLEHQFTVWSASSLAVPFLVEILMDGPPDGELRRAVLDMLMSVVSGELAVFADLRVPFDPAKFYADVDDPGTWRDEDRNTTREDEVLLDQMAKVWARASYEAVEASIPALLPLLDDADDHLAIGLITLLEIFPRSAVRFVGDLQRLDAEEFSDARREAARDALATLSTTT